MSDVPLWQTLLGVVGMLVWGALCGVPAVALYSLASRPRAGALSWLLLIVLMLVWLPLVTVLCVWAVTRLIGWPPAQS
jgi:hypothetical protein